MKIQDLLTGYTVAERMVDTPSFLDLPFGLFSPNYQEYENKQYIIEKLYKIATRNAKKNLEFSKICQIFRAFIGKAVFLENGYAGIKQLPRPSKITSFSGNLNGETLLKVSFKNIDRFQKYKALKSKIIKKAQFHKENGIKKSFSTSKLCISETSHTF